MNDEDPPKIGVFLHRGRTLPTLSALARWEREGYDEIVVVPEDAVPAPELLPAIIALNERLKEQGTIRLNLYVTRDSEEFAANFNIPQSDSHPGYDTFMNLIRQIYATRTPVTEVR